MADGGGGGGDGKRSWHKEREISPASDEEKLLLPYVAHALALFFLRRVLASSEPSSSAHLRTRPCLAIAALGNETPRPSPRHPLRVDGGRGGRVCLRPRAVVALHRAWQHAVVGWATRRAARGCGLGYVEGTSPASPNRPVKRENRTKRRSERGGA